jgi:hypothetical protein
LRVPRKKKNTWSWPRTVLGINQSKLALDGMLSASVDYFGSRLNGAEHDDVGGAET